MLVSGVPLKGGTQRSMFAKLLTSQGSRELPNCLERLLVAPLEPVSGLTEQAAEGPVETEDALDPGLRG